MCGAYFQGEDVFLTFQGENNVGSLVFVSVSYIINDNTIFQTFLYLFKAYPAGPHTKVISKCNRTIFDLVQNCPSALSARFAQY